ncbi:hypothetical protein SUGI_0387030 [Cryptomeria japonica]|nr:hypothetical protein SUGI_0387030 [Cryptomeria japonica]
MRSFRQGYLFWVALLDLGSNPHQSPHALSKRYGSLMYLKLGTTPALIASSQEAAVAILKTFDSDFSNRPENMGAVADILCTIEMMWPHLPSGLCYEKPVFSTS